MFHIVNDSSQVLQVNGSDSVLVDDAYPLLDAETNTYYRIVPLELSEEEWEAVKAAYDKETRLLKQPDRPAAQASENGDNAVAKALKVIAVIIYVCGAISAFAIGLAAESFVAAFAILFGGFVSGTMMLGFSEIVQLLGRMNDKLHEK